MARWWNRWLRDASFFAFDDNGPSLREVSRTAARDAEKAERRARRLLRSHLTKRQNESLTENNYFVVRGSHSDQGYRIYGRDPKCNFLGQNIHSLGFKYGVGLDSEHSFFADWDAHLCPPSDVMLAQKLLIETDEPKLLKIACKSPIRR